MNNATIEMIDVVFDLGGETLPATYPFALWAALTDHAPQLKETPSVGILPIRGTTIGENLIVTKRAKLTIRLPAALTESVTTRLSNQQLDLAGNTLHLGTGKARPIQPYPTIHAHHVTGNNDEVQFIETINTQLDAMKIKGGVICGKRHALNGDHQSIHGYSLVIHDLKPDASLQLQYAGLGENRQFGCGIFVPYKVITGLGDD